METNIPALGKENIQETLEVPEHSTEYSFLYPNLICGPPTFVNSEMCGYRRRYH